MTYTTLAKGETVNSESIIKICKALKIQPSDIMRAL
ncbi:MAG: helix-turn-helix domain-containing protein [Nitrososphaerota archaeon]|nr:helix-turn-helix domain-containing protein [Nitrososphaerota archaeon]